MRLRINRPSAWAAAFVAATTRIYYALAVDSSVHNGAWLSALAGMLLALPLLLCFDRLRHYKSNLSRPVKAVLGALLCLASTVDSGLVLSAVTRSSAFLALDEVPVLATLLPVLLALYWCVSRNGDAVGYGAMLFTRFFPVFLALVVPLQWRHYRPVWMLPLLGDGWQSVLMGGVRSACTFIPTAALLFLGDSTPEESGNGNPSASSLAFAASLAALLLFPRLMMAPSSLSGGSWADRVDTLLTNGRAPLYLQLPMIVLWYAALLHLLACETFTAALLLQRLIPRLDGRLCALLATLAAAAISCSPLPMTIPELGASAWVYPAVTMAAFLGSLSPRIAKRRS